MKADLYSSAENYFRGPEGMKDEVLMWFVASGLLMRELSYKQNHRPFGGLEKDIGYKANKEIGEVNILDMCSGPGNFSNHLSFVFPRLKAVCVDSNKKFIKWGKRSHSQFDFIEGNAVSISLGRKFEFVTVSSAYHHITDENKIDFLKNCKAHLAEDASILFCEHFLPDYTEGDDSRAKSVIAYYDAREKYYQNGNATIEAQQAIKEVRQQELTNDGEHKVSYAIFAQHLEAAELMVDVDIPIWQPPTFVGSNAGSHVLVVKPKI